MRILAIESSCDDTSAAVLADGAILSNIVASQDALHADYGGIVPELAARRHLETISTVIHRALEQADCEVGSIDRIAVTHGPGLVGSLLVGIAAAQGLSLRTGLPVDGINHLEGHVLSPLVHEDVAFPFLALLVSGGHTSLYLVRGVGEYEEVAWTRDDSAGEAFDKAAKMLGLGYPGGKVIDDLAREGNVASVRFPRGRVKADDLAWSFSGLKTSLWQFLSAATEGSAGALGGHRLEDVSASFQEAIVDALVARVLLAAERYGVSRVAVAGGVSANSRLRTRMTEAVGKLGGSAVFPPMNLCTDNAGMIGYAAWLRACRGLDSTDIAAASRLPLGQKRRLR